MDGCSCAVCCSCVSPSYGPRASKKYSTPFSERGQFLVDFKYAPFSQATRRSKRAGAGAAGSAYELEEKEMQQQLTEALAVSIHLEAFPKAVLEAYVQVLQDEGGVLASALTCISLALADAGVMLYDMVSACEAVSLSFSMKSRMSKFADRSHFCCPIFVVSQISLDQQLYLDPSAAESQQSLDAQSADPSDAPPSAPGVTSAGLVLAYMPSLKQITGLTQTGTTSAAQVTQLTHLCIAGCEQLNGLMRECLVEAAKRKIAAAAPQ
jgi:exosome complex component MTR3